MKIKSLIYSSLAATLLFASCDLNKQPSFDDDTQAFIAYDEVSGRVNEAVAGEVCTLEVTLYCASISGVNAQVEVVTSNEAYSGIAKAVENENYRIAKVETYTIDDNEKSDTYKERINVVETAFDASAPRVIKFDAQHRFASIYIETINDNNTIEIGDKRFDMTLTNVKGCNLGESKKFTVRISDDEDPINRLVGTYTAYAQSGFKGMPDENWTMEISRDDDNDKKIWIYPIVSLVNTVGVADDQLSPVYAIVDLDNQIISVPFGQSLWKNDSYGYDGKLCTIGTSDLVFSGAALMNYVEADGGVTISYSSYLGVWEVNTAGTSMNGEANGWFQLVDSPTFEIQ